MPQNADEILDHAKLFREPEYISLFENKKQNFEYGHSTDKVQSVCAQIGEAKEKGTDSSSGSGASAAPFRPPAPRRSITEATPRASRSGAAMKS